MSMIYSEEIIYSKIYTSANLDFSIISFSQNCIELNAKELIYKDNNFNFSITDEDDNVLDLNGQDVVFSICCYEQNNTMELMKQDILIKNISKLMN